MPPIKEMLRPVDVFPKDIHQTTILDELGPTSADTVHPYQMPSTDGLVGVGGWVRDPILSAPSGDQQVSRGICDTNHSLPGQFPTATQAEPYETALHAEPRLAQTPPVTVAGQDYYTSSPTNRESTAVHPGLLVTVGSGYSEALEALCQIDTKLEQVKNKVIKGHGTDDDIRRIDQRPHLNIKVGKKLIGEAAVIYPMAPTFRLTMDDQRQSMLVFKVEVFQIMVATMFGMMQEDATIKSMRTSPRLPDQLVFLTRAFISLWHLIARLDCIQIKVPSFDHYSPTVLHKPQPEPDYHRIEVRRKRTLVAFGLLQGLIYELHDVLVKLMPLLNEVTRQNQHNRPPAPNPELASYLAAIVGTIDRTPFNWIREDTSTGMLLTSILDDLKNVGKLVKGEVSLLSARVDSGIQGPSSTRASNTSVAPPVVQVISDTVEYLAASFDKDAHAFTSFVYLFDILSERYEEKSPSDKTIKWKNKVDERANRSNTSSSRPTGSQFSPLRASVFGGEREHAIPDLATNSIPTVSDSTEALIGNTSSSAPSWQEVSLASTASSSDEMFIRRPDQTMSDDYVAVSIPMGEMPQKTPKRLKAFARGLVGKMMKWKDTGFNGM